jgi:ABC-type sugar transport system ATPase subunit
MQAQEIETSTPILELRKICKNFGGVHALDDVNLKIYPNEILALVGDNGAGKSTLVKIISGLYLPDSGEIYFNNKIIKGKNPLQIRRLGIETVYQDLALVDTRDVGQNFFMGREPTIDRWGIWVDQKKVKDITKETIEKLGITIPSLKTDVRNLSGGQRQAIAVAKTILWGAKIVIMDEPTAALGITESKKVLNLVKRLKEHNVAVIIISHNLMHIYDVADRIVVLRGGKKVGSRIKNKSKPDEIVKLIMGVEKFEINKS